MDYTVTRRHGKQRDFAFYMDALRYAQSQWLAGKPAQAVLQLDKAWMADLAEGDDWRSAGADPYQALRWMLRRIARMGQGAGGFAGNPVRHFQHLASRMSGPRAEVRRHRAWLCMHLAEQVLPPDRYPRDGLQLAREGLWVPAVGHALAGLQTRGWPGEAVWVGRLLGSKQCDL